MFSDWFQSPAERKVNLIYGSMQNTLNPDAVVFADYSAMNTDSAISFEGSSNMDPITPGNISTLEAIREFFTPQSYAEALVNDIYSTPARTLAADPSYDPRDFSSPNVYVKAKGAVSDVLGGLTNFGGKALFVIVGVLLLGIAVNALIPALLARR